MSDVARNTDDRSHDVHGRRLANGLLERVEGGQSGQAERPVEVSGLAARARGFRPLRQRERDLRNLVRHALPWWGTEYELIASDLEARKIIASHLERACMAERQCGEAGHWTYSYPRHAAILNAYKVEMAEVAILESEAANDTP